MTDLHDRVGYTSDTVLELRAARGDLGALTELYHRHYRAVLNYMSRRPGSPHWRVGQALAATAGGRFPSGEHTVLGLSRLAAELDDICDVAHERLLPGR